MKTNKASFIDWLQDEMTAYNSFEEFYLSIQTYADEEGKTVNQTWDELFKSTPTKRDYERLWKAKHKQYFNWFGDVYSGKVEGDNFIADDNQRKYPIKIKERYPECGLINKINQNEK